MDHLYEIYLAKSWSLCVMMYRLKSSTIELKLLFCHRQNFHVIRYSFFITNNVLITDFLFSLFFAAAKIVLPCTLCVSRDVTLHSIAIRHKLIVNKRNGCTRAW